VLASLVWSSYKFNGGGVEHHSLSLLGPTTEQNFPATARQHWEDWNMKRREFLKAGAALGGAGMLGTLHPHTALAQAKLVLKATDVHPLGYPTVEAVINMGKKLEAGTSGRLSIQMYPSMQLGGEKEMIEQAQVGALAFARISVGPMGPIVPELNVFNLPFLFRDDAHMEKVVDGEIGNEMLKKLTDHPTAGLIGLCWMNGGTRNVYNGKKPVRTPDDLKGLKIRMMGNPLFVDTMNALGGNGVAMGYDQLVNALQTGVVDGAENNYPSYATGQHYRYAKYYSLTGHLMIPELLVFSKRTWGTLSKADQDLILKLSKEAQAEQRKLWYAMEEKSIAQMKEAGAEIIKIDNKQAFQDLVKPVWDKYGAQHAALIKRIQDVK
jgi:tripartite ATP-independent transporter DctP family solute receptor